MRDKRLINCSVVPQASNITWTPRVLRIIALVFLRFVGVNKPQKWDNKMRRGRKLLFNHNKTRKHFSDAILKIPLEGSTTDQCRNVSVVVYFSFSLICNEYTTAPRRAIHILCTNTLAPKSFKTISRFSAPNSPSSPFPPLWLLPSHFSHKSSAPPLKGKNDNILP